MRFLFDMDGTIVDTYRAVKMAYRRAGITMPEEAWGKPWQAWCPKDIHDEKVRLYPNFIREYGRILPAADLLRMTGGRILTGASAEATRAVREVLDIDFPVMASNCTEDEKIKYLAEEMVLSVNGPVMYFDDRKDFGLRALSTLKDIGGRFIFAHAAEQDGCYYIYDSAKPGRTQRWTLSSWLLVGTSV